MLAVKGIIYSPLTDSNLTHGDVYSFTASQVSMGRVLRRLVHLFRSARDLVAENDDKTDRMLEDVLVPSTAESALLSSSFAAYCHLIVLCIRQESGLRSYEELIKRVPLIKRLCDQAESTEALEQFYRNVSSNFFALARSIELF